MTDDIRAVPCGSCHKCCNGETITLTDDENPEQYGVENLCIIPSQDGNGQSLALKWKENGDCIMLGENGCTVWPNHPTMCKQYDCRLHYIQLMSMSRRQRRALAKQVVGPGTGDAQRMLKEYLDIGGEMLAKHPIEPRAGDDAPLPCED
jgi:hypothetical protein